MSKENLYLNLIIVLIITIVAIILLFGCSGTNNYPDYVATQIATKEITPVPTPIVLGSYQIPNRYIDWQAGVVCWYLQDAISCMKLSDTTILGGQ